ncbi:MAG: NADP(H)-dependent aldo-keto reductase [Vampirovibrionales bacterium]
MDYRQLGRTDLNVSVICLGTMTWGQQNTEAEAHEQLEYAISEGVNFFDTAEMYAIPPTAETQGLTEKYLGTWLAKHRHARDKYVVATKVVGPTLNPMYGFHWIRGGETRFNSTHLNQAVEGSLKRLQTDYIDLYQLHWPDREVNTFGELFFEYPQSKQEEVLTPLFETLSALQTLQKEGKIRHIGVSNETAWGVMQALKLAETHGLPRIESIQNVYHLMNRGYELGGLSEISYREDVGLLAYSPLAFGLLSGKYLTGTIPKGSRIEVFGGRMQRYLRPEITTFTQRYVDLAKAHGLSPVQMALAFVNHRPFVTSNIIGATTMAQLKENIASKNVILSQEVLDAINTIALENPIPAA